MPLESIVYVVDDDDAVREGLELVIAGAGLRVETYGAAEEFLERYPAHQPGCLVLDIEMPGISGLELQERLTAEGITLPIIILTGHGDVPGAVRALKKGAVDFLEKPFRSEALLGRIRQALERDAEIRRESERRASITERLARLTPREREILDMVVTGKPNKVIGIELGISERTVELHRSRIMKKMEARTLPDLMRLTLPARND